MQLRFNTLLIGVESPLGFPSRAPRAKYLLVQIEALRGPPAQLQLRRLLPGRTPPQGLQRRALQTSHLRFQPLAHRRSRHQLGCGATCVQVGAFGGRVRMPAFQGGHLRQCAVEFLSTTSQRLLQTLSGHLQGSASGSEVGDVVAVMFAVRFVSRFVRRRVLTLLDACCRLRKHKPARVVLRREQTSAPVRGPAPPAVLDPRLGRAEAHIGLRELRAQGLQLGGRAPLRCCERLLVHDPPPGPGEPMLKLIPDGARASDLLAQLRARASGATPHLMRLCLARGDGLGHKAEARLEQEPLALGPRSKRLMLRPSSVRQARGGQRRPAGRPRPRRRQPAACSGRSCWTEPLTCSKLSAVRQLGQRESHGHPTSEALPGAMRKCAAQGWFRAR
mmetsp:Transcript_98967/g.317338  ORF Transcript_98967/g.317338 Transcript_98967/m.317338 type:complete len:390 (-) Transcript_98967:985-2154(-)